MEAIHTDGKESGAVENHGVNKLESVVILNLWQMQRDWAYVGILP